MTFIDRLKLIYRILELLPRLELLDRFLPKMEAYERLVGKLEKFEERTAGLQVLEATIHRIHDLDSALSRMTEKKVEDLPKANGKPDQVAVQAMHEWNRLKLLAQFASLAGRAQEIETEWQRIQQDEHDADFAFQTLKGHSEELTFIYKKGIGDGIKWCINRFS